ncbi:MAG: hypothetical protein IKL02_10950 [Kiritimatiellae bacterium]|nr:hypothetical protein [Clostridia bacterium]MBR3778092.1 hypothetical protein [Kiritimatiellia bacterium]
MKIALLKNDTVVNVIVCDTVEHAAAIFPQYDCVEMADDLIFKKPNKTEELYSKMAEAILEGVNGI